MVESECYYVEVYFCLCILFFTGHSTVVVHLFWVQKVVCSSRTVPIRRNGVIGNSPGSLSGDKGSSPFFANYKMNLFFFLEAVVAFIALIIPLLLAIAYFTLFERQILAALQRRQGPNVVGFFGILQPIADGLKLLLKESIMPKSANLLIFTLSPILSFGLAMAG